MGFLNAVSNMTNLAGLVDWLYGCSHRRTTFPITLRTTAGSHGRLSAQSETYTVCLACGRHFAYDWSAMRGNRKWFGLAHKRPGEVAATEILHEQRL